MRVRWNDQAKKQLRQVIFCVRESFGKTSKDQFLFKIRRINQLLRNPYLGKKILLVSRSKDYRSILVTPINKIIYHINNDPIEVVAIGDTRREPKTLVKDLEDSEKPK